MLMPYFAFLGDCADAMELYTRAFGGHVAAIEYYDGPNGERWVLHAHVELPGVGWISAGDIASPLRRGDALSLLVLMTDDGQARRAWDVLAGEGTVTDPLTPRGFAQLHGAVMDKFGFQWIFSVASQKRAKTHPFLGDEG